MIHPQLWKILLVLAIAQLSLPAWSVPLDPAGEVRSDLLGAALAALEEHPEVQASHHLVVVDYSKHSSSPRLYILDLQTGAVESLRTAHGAGSDKDHDGYLESFSSQAGSNASPQGAFRLAEEYMGRHGRSIRLDGLEPQNINARDRAIVIHAADYAEPIFLKRYGKLGRSNGCIVFSKADLETFREEVPTGTLVFIGR